jgi:hypothetical protein
MFFQVLYLYQRFVTQWKNDYPKPKDVVHSQSEQLQLTKFLQDPPMYWQQSPIQFIKLVLDMWAKYYISGGNKLSRSHGIRLRQPSAAHGGGAVPCEEWKDDMSVNGMYILDEKKIAKFYHAKGIDAEKALLPAPTMQRSASTARHSRPTRMLPAARTSRLGTRSIGMGQPPFSSRPHYTANGFTGTQV